MYLSQIKLNLRSRDARWDLGDRFELHRTILAGFPQALPSDERVLFRVEQGMRGQSFVTVIVQSIHAPNWKQVEKMARHNYLAETPQIRLVEPHVQGGQRLPFRLQANATIKRDGKRHALQDDEALMTWLIRKSQQHGFLVDVMDVRINKLGKVLGEKRKRVWGAVQYDGILTISQPDAFTSALRDGIGSAKAFGFGLLSIPYA